MEEIVAGIDIGGTNTTFGLIDGDGKVLVKDGIKTRDYLRVEDFVEKVSEGITRQVETLRSRNPDFHLKGIGIGAPNANPRAGTIENAPNLSWKGIVPLAAMFKERMGARVLLTNDAKAAAIGEQIFGSARGMKDFIVITLGTGLGSGIIANGEVIYGNDGFAGELGHVIIQQGGRLCGCGRHGCLETYCSATGLVKTYKELHPDAEDHADAKLIAGRANAGEPEAIEAFRYTGEILGFALANSVAYTSPEAIFLFGGLIKAGDLLFKPTRESFEKNLLKNYQGHIRIEPSSLHEGDAAVLGAASLIWREK